MLQRPKLDRGVVRPIERTRIDGNKAASPVGEQPYERLRCVSAHGLPNENRPFESLAREDLLEHQRKVVQAPVERERPRLPMGRGIPHQAPCPLGKVINLLIRASKQKRADLEGPARSMHSLRREVYYSSMRPNFASSSEAAAQEGQLQYLAPASLRASCASSIFAAVSSPMISFAGP